MTHGGSCLRGKSDIYIHCGIDEDIQVELGSWSEWGYADNDARLCTDPGNSFKQKERVCKTETENYVPFCPGTWLKVIF